LSCFASLLARAVKPPQDPSNRPLWFSTSGMVKPPGRGGLTAYANGAQVSRGKVLFGRPAYSPPPPLGGIKVLSSRDLILLDGVARCDSSGRDTPSATDAGGPLDLHG
jgi:hypothetical protein